MITTKTEPELIAEQPKAKKTKTSTKSYLPVIKTQRVDL